MAGSRDDDFNYDWKLRLSIQESFVKYIKPLNILPYFGKYGEHVLVQADYQVVTAVTTNQGDQAGALCLLERICMYRGWFECLLTVLRDPNVKLPHVADLMVKAKCSLDSKLEQDGGYPKAVTRNLPEGTCPENQRIMEFEAERNRPGHAEVETSQLSGASSSKTKVTEKVYTELRNVDKIIGELSIQHETMVSQLEQAKENLSHSIGQECRQYERKIRQLEQEKENLERLIQQERKHQKDQIKLHKQEIKQLKDQTKEKDQVIDTECRRREEEVKEREPLDHTIEQERRQHEEEVRKLKEEKEKLEKSIQQERKRKNDELDHHKEEIKRLKKETYEKNENLERLIQQERKHQRDQIKLHKEEIEQLEDQTRQKDQLITNLKNVIQNLEIEKKKGDTTKREISDLLSCTQHNDGVILFNYFVMCGWKRYHPNLLKKYNIQEWGVPLHLHDTAKWTVNRFHIYCRDECEEIRKHGLTAAKKFIQRVVAEVLNNVNRRKEKEQSEIRIKYWLHVDIIYFFFSCYSCLIGLDRHGEHVIKECLIDIQTVITKNLDKLVQNNGGWCELMSQATSKRFWEQAFGLGLV